MRYFPILLLALVAARATAAKVPQGMFDVYAANRAEGRPNLITEDFALLAYSMTLDRAMAETEEKVLLPDSIRIVEALSKSVPGDNPVARGAVDFLSVVSALLKGEEPSEPSSVAAEVKRVRAAAGIARSDLMLQSLDYSQFRPRGRYTRSPALQRYFQGTRYAGTVLFPIVATQATGVTAEEADRLTAEALLLTRGLRGGPALYYARVNRRLGVLFGPAEDLSVADFAAIPADSAPAEARKQLLVRARKNGHQPAILAAPVDVGKLEPGVTASDALTGWRLFPLRYTPDSAAMQQLIFDRVKVYKGTGHPESLAVISGQKVKGFPLGDEVMALLGSDEALRALDRSDERNYEGYPEAFKKASTVMKGGTDLTSRQLRIAGEWLKAGEGANAAQRLDSALGFWTWIRYNNFLYSKQSYTAVMKGIPAMSPRDQAWIEPSALYLKLAAQLDTLKLTLPGETLPGMAKLLRQCSDISRRETAGGAPTPTDVEFLNRLDLAFLNFAGVPDHPIVIDVHTEPNSGMVLEEATGFPGSAAHKLASGETAIGARFTHREFKQPLSHRLNDEDWLLMLEKERMTKADTSRSVGLHASAMFRLIRASAQDAPAGQAEDYVSLDRLGKALKAQGNWQQALAAFERALSLAPNRELAAQAHAHIGEALGKLGRETEGIEHLEESLDLHHYDQVEDELKEMRLSLFSRKQTAREIGEALHNQEASHRGTRPLAARPLPLKVLFEFDRAVLTPEGREQADQLGAAMASPEWSGRTFHITGHTDLVGKPEYNQKLSEQRAAAVAEEISKKFGIPRNLLTTEGKGMTEPLNQSRDPNSKESELNRRVEVLVVGQ